MTLLKNFPKLKADLPWAS